MKTPEENKCGMECIRTNAERVCIKPEKGQCPRCKQLVDDVHAYIQHLETRLAQVERERDALMHDVSKCRRCETCAKRRIPIHKCPHFDGGTQYPCWQWRGVCPENTKEDA